MMVVATVNANLMHSQKQSKAGLMKIVDDNIKKVWELKVVELCWFLLFRWWRMQYSEKVPSLSIPFRFWYRQTLRVCLNSGPEGGRSGLQDDIYYLTPPTSNMNVNVSDVMLFSSHFSVMFAPLLDWQNRIGACVPAWEEKIWQLGRKETKIAYFPIRYCKEKFILSKQLYLFTHQSW